jgi:hypothetical protein
MQQKASTGIFANKTMLGYVLAALGVILAIVGIIANTNTLLIVAGAAVLVVGIFFYRRGKA